MKISLNMVKNVLMEMRNVDFEKIFADKDGEGVKVVNIVKALFESIDEKKINSICSIITGKNDVVFTDDLLGEDGALEVISDFLGSIMTSYQKSKNFKMLIQMLWAKVSLKETKQEN